MTVKFNRRNSETNVPKIKFKYRTTTITAQSQSGIISELQTE